MPIGMPIITATLWTGSKASAGWRPHHASALAMFVVSTVRWASETGSAFSQLLKDRIASLMGILSTNHELYVVGTVRRLAGSKAGGAGASGVPMSARCMGVELGVELD